MLPRREDESVLFLSISSQSTSMKLIVIAWGLPWYSLPHVNFPQIPLHPGLWINFLEFMPCSLLGIRWLLHIFFSSLHIICYGKSFSLAFSHLVNLIKISCNWSRKARSNWLRDQVIRYFTFIKVIDGRRETITYEWQIIFVRLYQKSIQTFNLFSRPSESLLVSKEKGG